MTKRLIKRLGLSFAIVMVLAVPTAGIALSNSMRDYARMLAGLDVLAGSVFAADSELHRRVPLLDATLYERKTPGLKNSFPPIKVIYESELWSQADSREKQPISFRLKTAVGKYKRDPLLVIDIEHWALFDQGGALNQQNLDKYLSVLKQAKAFAPEVKIGFYGMPPVSDYWRAIDAKPEHRREDWRRENDAIQALADLQGAFYPSLYTFYADQKGWVEYAEAQIAEARRLAGNKPVYVFLWPQYHDSNKLLGCRFIAADFWRLQLATASRLADGVIIWGGWEVCKKDGGPMKWDEQAEWWLVTKDFL